MMLKQIKNRVVALANDERGASAIEYAVMAAVLIIVIAAAIGFLDLDGVFSSLGTKVQSATPGPGA
ncbi:Flp family type IVb pilin [Spongiibacter tropicus]|uniref:Flp family type IVb pilin n=1 Tax=Spongiibacter tropicus TaxID=454602 RepID=UPI003A99EA42